MNLNFRPVAVVAVAGLAGWLALNLPSSAQQPAAAPKAAKGKGGGFKQDPRVQSRTYHFEDTNVDLPYSVYVSTKVNKDQKAPLIVTLHGLGSTPQVMMTKAAVDMAEAGGYILVAPMGYNSGGWYGSPVINMGAGRGRGRGPGAAKGGDNPAPPAAAAPPPAPPNDTPANLAELSEKDVMNVIGMVRKEFNIDDKRMYLMGHSMGGAGTIFLGSKHAELWAAIGAEAPADFRMDENRTAILQRLKDNNVPVMIVQGDIDEAVPDAHTRQWIDAMKELQMKFEFVEQGQITHGPVIESGLRPIYGFFAAHTKP